MYSITASRMISGLVLKCEMESVLSSDDAVKSLVRSQVVLSDSALLWCCQTNENSHQIAAIA
jgi:hypothetical protein